MRWEPNNLTSFGGCCFLVQCSNHIKPKDKAVRPDGFSDLSNGPRRANDTDSPLPCYRANLLSRPHNFSSLFLLLLTQWVIKSVAWTRSPVMKQKSVRIGWLASDVIGHGSGEARHDSFSLLREARIWVLLLMSRTLLLLLLVPLSACQLPFHSPPIAEWSLVRPLAVCSLNNCSVWNWQVFLLLKSKDHWNTDKIPPSRITSLPPCIVGINNHHDPILTPDIFISNAVRFDTRYVYYNNIRFWHQACLL